MIRTGSNGDAGDRKGDARDRKGDTGEADSLPGKRRRVSVLASIDGNDMVFRIGGTGTGIIPKQRLISDELGPSSKQIAGQNFAGMRLSERFQANGSRACAPDDRLRGYRFA
jgi:hypothetical protein